MYTYRREMAEILFSSVQACSAQGNLGSIQPSFQALSPYPLLSLLDDMGGKGEFA